MDPQSQAKESSSKKTELSSFLSTKEISGHRLLVCNHKDQVQVFSISLAYLLTSKASTPGVSLPTSISLKPYTKHRRNAPQRVGHSGAIATTELILHSSEHPKLDYTAREEESSGADTLLKHYVGVYDPDTGKLEVMEARKMVIRGVVRAQQATVADQISSVSLHPETIIVARLTVLP
jgi:hypothetical protein